MPGGCAIAASGSRAAAPPPSPQIARDLAWANDLLETPTVERVEAIGEYGVTLKVLGRVRAPALPGVTGELRRRLLGAFAANGIELPRPRSVVLASTAAPDPFAPAGA